MQSGTPNYKALVSRAAQPCRWDELGTGLLETRRVLLESRLWVSFTAPPREEVGCEPRAPGDTPETKSESGCRCLPPRRAAALCPGLTSRAQIPAFPCRQICPCKGWGRGWGGSSRHLGGGGTAMPLRPCEHRSPARNSGVGPGASAPPRPAPGRAPSVQLLLEEFCAAVFGALFLTCLTLFFPSRGRCTKVDDARGYKGSVACS